MINISLQVFINQAWIQKIFKGGGDCDQRLYLFRLKGGGAEDPKIAQEMAKFCFKLCD